MIKKCVWNNLQGYFTLNSIFYKDCFHKKGSKQYTSLQGFKMKLFDLGERKINKTNLNFPSNKSVTLGH